MPDDNSLDRASAAVGELSKSVRALTTEVMTSEALRAEKIKALQRLMYVLVPAVALLLGMAVTNFMLLSRVNGTNELFASCYRDGTECSNSNNARFTAALEQVRQTQFVMVICQRINPIGDDPDGTALRACVRTYYPTFELPARGTSTAPPTRFQQSPVKPSGSPRATR